MENFAIIMIVGAILLVVFKIVTTSSFKASDEAFEQAGVKVVFNTGKITIRGNTYNVEEVQGISSRIISKFGTEVFIKVDDFKKPIHKIGISGFNGAGEKFIQRLSTALRKAGGHDFY